MLVVGGLEIVLQVSTPLQRECARGGIGLTLDQPLRSQELSYRDVLEILEVVKKSGWGDIEIEVGGSRLKVTRTQGASDKAVARAIEPESSSAMAAVVGREEIHETSGPTETAATKGNSGQSILAGMVSVLPPMAGIFYSSPSPGADPFVSVGDTVEDGQQLGIVEVMKLFTPVVAPCFGTVKEVLASNEEFVEKDQVIMVIEPVEG